MPNRTDFGWGAPPPPPLASIPQAAPNSPAGQLEENRALRERLAWVEDRNRKLSQKSSDLDRDLASIQADANRYAAERDRYRAQAGGR